MTEQIEENPIPLVSIERPMTVESKRKSVLLIIAISLIVISLIAAGVYAGIQIGKKQTIDGIPKDRISPKETPQLIIETITLKPTEIPNETTNWKTYDSICSFSFKYPSEFSISKTSNEVILESPGSNKRIVFEVNSFDNIYEGIKNLTEDEAIRQSLSNIVSEKEYFFGVEKSIRGRNLVVRRHLDNGGNYDEEIIYYKGENCSFMLRVDKDTSPRVLVDQILSTFRFISQVTSQVIPSPTGSMIKIPYSPPADWIVQTNRAQVFQISYDPAKYGVKVSDDTSVQVVRKNLENWPYYSPYASSTYFTVYPYDNGSRHRFIEKQLGETINENNKFTGKYKETEYVVSGRKCLIIDGISISQYPTTWGMCPISTGQALLITTFDSEYLINFLKTLRFL